MAEAIQLDKAAALVGKSEVTLRRLIKAGKIPFEKQKTLTGFVYLVNPDHVKTFYKVREGSIFDRDVKETIQEKKADSGESQSATGSVRVAVAGDEGGAPAYWQKRSELYEDRYTNEVVKHAQTREELGAWRGRAEQAQSMLMKLLPAPSSEVEVQTESANDSYSHNQQSSSVMAVVTIILLTLTIALIAGAIVYLQFVA